MAATKLGHPVEVRSVSINISKNGGSTSVNASLQSAITTEVGPVTENVPNVWLDLNGFPAFDAAALKATSWSELFDKIAASLQGAEQYKSQLGLDA